MSQDVSRPEPSNLPKTSSPPPAPTLSLNTFRALRHRNYRLYFFGQLVSVTGSWVQTTALTWLAFDLTRSSTWTSAIGVAQVLPTFLLGAWGGMVADRWPKRQLIFTTQTLLLVLALALAAMVLFGQPTPWGLFAVALASGVVNALDLPARLAFVMDMVGRDDLMNAVALNSLLFNTARTVGPAVGVGLMHYLGAGHCFLINGLSFLAVLVALAGMDVTGAAPRHTSRGGLRAVVSGFRYLADRRGLVLLLALTAAMSLCGWPVLSLLPALSADRLGEGQGGYGWMLSGVGVGALTAALLIATFGTRVRKRWFLGAGVVLAATSLAALALVRWLPLAVLCCAGLGGGLILFFATSQSVMQLSAGEHNRGRIMGIWSMVLSGAQPLGNLLAGPAADHWGVPAVLAAQTLAIAGAAAIVLVLAVAVPTEARTPSPSLEPSGNDPEKDISGEAVIVP